MSTRWLVRWETSGKERPFLFIPGNGTGASVTRFGPAFENGFASFAAFSGYLFDKADLHPDPKASEADCAVNAYRQHGQGLFDRLRGGWALAIWDEARGQFLAGRDAMGLHPLYYHWNGRLLLLSPDLDLILAQPEVEGRFNRIALAEYILEIWHPHQTQETFYEEVCRLPAAHRLCLEAGHLRIERYWDPIPPGFKWANEEELAEFYPTLERAVGRCLEVGADSISLSGGFDSVSLAVLAAEQLRGKPPLHALSLHFDAGPADEGDVQKAVAQTLGMPQVMVAASRLFASESTVQNTLELSLALPLPVFGLWQSLYNRLLESAATLGLRSTLMGTGGDEMMSVDLAFAADCLASFHLSDLWSFYQANARSTHSSPLRVARNIFWSYSAKVILVELIRSAVIRVLPQILERRRARRMGFPAWFVPSDAELKETLLDRSLHPPPVEMAPGEGRYVSAIRSFPQSSLFLSQMEQGFHWARRHGVILFYPYFDRDLVELSLRMYPIHLISGGRAKAPLRRLVANRLSMVNLPSRKVDFTNDYDRVLRQHGHPVWQALGKARRLADLGLVAPEKLAACVEDYFAGRSDRRRLVWSVLSAESWLNARSN